MSATILVVDGDPVFRFCLKISLQEAGFVVHLAPNVQEALAILPKVEIDLLMIDAKCVEGAGSRLGSALRISRQLPVILMASSKSPEDMMAAFVAGADAYVTKPFSLGDVRASIQQQIQSASLPMHS